MKQERSNKEGLLSDLKRMHSHFQNQNKKIKPSKDNMDEPPPFIQEESKASYSQEDAYFYNIDRELIAQKRKSLDEKRKLKNNLNILSNWMKCPKCGSILDEISSSGITADRCPQCEGIYFDKGELEIMTETQGFNNFLLAIKESDH